MDRELSHYGPTVSLRRYALDGTLLRFVESTLPTPTEGSWNRVEPSSVREQDGRVVFDRLIGDVANLETRYLVRETFEVVP